VTSAIITVVFACRATTWRMGAAISPGGEDRGRHLVEQRLEQVVVGAVNEQHIGRRVAQGLRGREAAEASTHDDHAQRMFADPP